MTFYQYEAQDTDGRATRGEIESTDLSTACAQLEAQGLRILSIRVSSAPHDLPAEMLAAELIVPVVSSTAAGPRSPVVRSEVIASQREQMRIEANTAWREVLQHPERLRPLLRAAADESPDATRQKFERILQHLDRGGRQAEELPADATLRDAIPELWSATRNADPVSSIRSMARVAPDAHPNPVRLRRRSWTYLLILVFVNAAIATLLGLFVIPVFEAVFLDFAVELPVLTRGLLEFSRVVVNPLTWMILAAVATVIAIAISRRWIRLDAGWLGIPAAWSDFAAGVAQLREAGVSVPTASRLASLASSRRTVHESGLLTAAQIESPQLAAGMLCDIPATLSYALQLDQPPEVQAAVLRTIAQIKSDSSRRESLLMASLTGPIGILLVSLLVGLTILGLLLPLVSLIQNLS